MTVQECTNQAEWDANVKSLHGHPLQLWGWGELKGKHNWRAYRFLVEDGDAIVGGVQILQRTMPWPFRSMLYAPRGPFGDVDAVLAATTREVGERFAATHLTIEPDGVAPIKHAGWRKVSGGILLARTAVMNLSESEEQLLSAMAKKTRQYIRKSAAAGVEVREVADADDIAACLSLYRQTADRAGFRLHDDSYYYDLHREMGEASKIYLASHQGRAVAFLWLVATDEVAFELYGGMNDEGQALRANYTLKWQAIQAMKSRGVRRYDMNGLLNDGVSTFKRSFVREETQLAGAYDYRLSIWYLPWKRLFPGVKKVVQLLASLRK